MPNVQHLDELNLLLTAGSREEQNRVIAGRSQTIGAGVIAERENLLSLAGEGNGVSVADDGRRPVRSGLLTFPEINASGCQRG